MNCWSGRHTLNSRATVPRPRVGRGSAGITATEIFTSGDWNGRLARICRITHVAIGTGEQLRVICGACASRCGVDGLCKGRRCETATATEHNKIVARLAL